LDKKQNSLQHGGERNKNKSEEAEGDGQKMGRRWELVEQQSKSKANSHTSKDVCATTQSNFESCTNSMTQKKQI
jgi:hypothetical protein